MSIGPFPVEAGHIMLFARAVGDADPIYADAEYAATTEHGGVIAPPTFVAALAHFDPDWKHRPRPGHPWRGSGQEPSGVDEQPSGTGLHAEQHYEYHQELRPGDVLTAERVPGSTWEKHSERAGRLAFEEEITRFHNQRGELVVTATHVRVVTERAVDQ